MAMAPLKQRVAIVTENGTAFGIGIADVPGLMVGLVSDCPSHCQILVKVAAAAQNPSDC